MNYKIAIVIVLVPMSALGFKIPEPWYDALVAFDLLDAVVLFFLLCGLCDYEFGGSDLFDGWNR